MAVKIGNRYYGNLEWIRHTIIQDRHHIPKKDFSVIFTKEQGRCYYDKCKLRDRRSDVRVIFQWRKKGDSPMMEKSYRERTYGFHSECLQDLEKDRRFGDQN